MSLPSPSPWDQLLIKKRIYKLHKPGKKNEIKKNIKHFLWHYRSGCDSKRLENQQFEAPLAQASVLIEHATELQHRTACQQWASQYELEPESNFK